MFQFAGFPPHSYGFTLRWHAVHAGFPHSDIRGSMLMCSSPRLFAAYRVFHRLPVPGHPPCALLCLTSLYHPSSPSGSDGRSKMVLTCSYRRICKACPSCSLVLLAICFLDFADLSTAHPSILLASFSTDYVEKPRCTSVQLRFSPCH